MFAGSESCSRCYLGFFFVMLEPTEDRSEVLLVVLGFLSEALLSDFGAALDFSPDFALPVSLSLPLSLEAPLLDPLLVSAAVDTGFFAGTTSDLPAIGFLFAAAPFESAFVSCLPSGFLPVDDLPASLAFEAAAGF